MGSVAPCRVRGLSLLSALVVLVVLGMTVYVTARLLPLYLEYKGVALTLDRLAASGAHDVAEIRRTLAAGFDSSNVTTIRAEDVDVIAAPGGFQADVTYDAVAPFLGNLGFVAHFHKAVVIADYATP